MNRLITATLATAAAALTAVTVAAVVTPTHAVTPEEAALSSALGGGYDIEFGLDPTPTPPREPVGTRTLGQLPLQNASWFADGAFQWNNYKRGLRIEPITVDNLLDVYGKQVCTPQTRETDECELLPAYTRALQAMNATTYRGHCAGIAAVYAGLASGYFTPENLRSPDGHISTIPLDGNDTLQRLVNNFIVMEWTEPVVGRNHGEQWDLSPSDVVPTLLKYWERGETPIMGITSHRLGHAVVPTRISQVGETTYWIWVMDPNFPRTEIPVVIRLSDPDHPSWSYVPFPEQEAPGVNYAGNGKISLIPFSVGSPNTWGDVEPSIGIRDNLKAA